jgi:hypothetical protein
MHPKIEDIIADTKTFRRDIDGLIQRLKNVTTLDPSVTGSDGKPAEPVDYRASRERSLSLTKLQEAVMWLGMDLKAIGEEYPQYVSNPYPSSKDPNTTRIEPTADGLKL